MTEENENIETGFIRQRRNLLAATVVLLAFNVAGIKFSQINLLGNVADISNPQVIIKILWILTCYFYIRYLYYLKRVGGISEGKGEYSEKFNALVKTKALHSLVRDEKPMEYVDTNKYPEDKIKSVEFTAGNVSRYKEYPVIDMEMDINVKLVMNDEVLYLPIKENEKVRFEYTSLRGEKGLAFFHVIFSTRVPTEYYLPLLFPIGVVLYIFLK